MQEACIEMETKPIKRLANIDYEGFAKEIFALKKQTMSRLSRRDYLHLRKIIWINRICTFVGYATAWIVPNPLSAYFISQGIFGRWLVMHHIGHGGYDQVPDIPKRFTSKVFAQGWHRFVDWFDWIWPPAWNYEHNILHHFHTGEHKDPDLVEDHAEFLRKSNYPTVLKYIIVAITSVTWKFTYYAPNTLLAMEQKGRSLQSTSLLKLIWSNGFDLSNARVRKLWISCYLPYMIVSFCLIPMLFLFIGKTAAIFVLINRILAELMTNFHSFLVIGPNHSGEDIHRFDYHFKGKAEFAVNQVISSCNYRCGTESIDYLQIWLNYQIEHHLFPRLPMLKYREVQPQVKELCERFNVPYVQESIFSRFRKMLNIMVGNTNMLWLKENSMDPSLQSVEGLGSSQK